MLGIWDLRGGGGEVEGLKNVRLFTKLYQYPEVIKLGYLIEYSKTFLKIKISPFRNKICPIAPTATTGSHGAMSSCDLGRIGSHRTVPCSESRIWTFPDFRTVISWKSEYLKNQTWNNSIFLLQFFSFFECRFLSIVKSDSKRPMNKHFILGKFTRNIASPGNKFIEF